MTILTPAAVRERIEDNRRRIREAEEMRWRVAQPEMPQTSERLWVLQALDARIAGLKESTALLESTVRKLSEQPGVWYIDGEATE